MKAGPGPRQLLVSKVTRKEARSLGLTKYVAAQSCVYGHDPIRLTCNGNCVKCQTIKTLERRARDPSIHREIRKRSYENNKDRVAVLSRAWLDDNPEAARARSTRRRGRVRDAEGHHSGEDILSLFKTQRGRCAALHCRTKLPKGYHIDHKTPLARGGSNWPDNLQLLCQPCNNSKGTKTVPEWRPCL